MACGRYADVRVGVQLAHARMQSACSFDTMRAFLKEHLPGDRSAGTCLFCVALCDPRELIELRKTSFLPSTLNRPGQEFGFEVLGCLYSQVPNTRAPSPWAARSWAHRYSVRKSSNLKTSVSSPAGWRGTGRGTWGQLPLSCGSVLLVKNPARQQTFE